MADSSLRRGLTGPLQSGFRDKHWIYELRSSIYDLAWLGWRDTLWASLLQIVNQKSYFLRQAFRGGLAVELAGIEEDFASDLFDDELSDGHAGAQEDGVRPEVDHFERERSRPAGMNGGGGEVNHQAAAGPAEQRGDTGGRTHRWAFCGDAGRLRKENRHLQRRSETR